MSRPSHLLRALGVALLAALPLPLHAQAPQNTQTITYNAFTPTGWATLAPTNTTSRVPLGSTGAANTAFIAWVQNVGSFPANVTLGNSSVNATLTSGVYVAAGQCVALNAVGATHLAGISASGTTLNVMTGTGTPGPCASASGGGGGGGNSTIISPLGGTTAAAASVAVVYGSGVTLPAFAATPTFNIGTAPTIAVTGTFFQATQPVSAAALPLPTGAATAANQTAVQAAAGASSTSALGVQGVSGGLAVKTDGSGVTQPVSAAALPLPAGAATAANQTNASQKSQIVDGSGNVIASTSNNLNVQCANCSGSGVSTGDEATFTAGASLFAGSGGFFQTTATSNPLTTGQQGLFQVTANRALFTNLRNSSGTEIGTAAAPMQVSMANTGANATAVKVDGSAVTQPVSGTVTANAGTNLNTSALALDATLTGGTQKTKIVDTGGTNVASVSAGGAVKVDGSAVTQPVSAASLPLPSGASTGVTDEGAFTGGASTFTGGGGFFQTTATSNALTTGQQGTFQVTANRALFTNLRNAAGTEVGTSTTPLQVSLANTAANATAVKVDGSAVTQPVSGTVTANAGTNLNTSALALDATLTGGTAKTKLVDSGGTNVATVSAAGAVKVDGSAVTQPVSLAANQSTNVAQVAGTNTDTNSGVKSAGTLRVVLATDQPQLTNKLLVTPDANSAINEAQINGVTPLMGNGATGTGSQRVTIASDNSAVAGVGAAATGAAVPANAVYQGMNVGGNITAPVGDPCQVNAHTYTPISISAASTTVIVAGTSAKKTYVCGMMLFSAGTTNVGIVQGSGSTCGTSTLGLIGGATAATGPNLTAQSGFVLPTGGYASAATTVNANDVCLINSLAIQVSGFIVTVVQ